MASARPFDFDFSSLSVLPLEAAKGKQSVRAEKVDVVELVDAFLSEEAAGLAFLGPLAPETALPGPVFWLPAFSPREVLHVAISCSALCWDIFALVIGYSLICYE